MWIPIYDVGKGFFEVIFNELYASFGAGNGDPLSTGVAGYYFMSLCLSIPFYWFLLFLIESRILSSCFNSVCGGMGGRRRALDNSLAPRVSVRRFTGNVNEVDEDVIEEEKKVERMHPDDVPARVYGIRKVYGDVVACKNVSFGLEYGECFALLGVSGAGKTTTFKCLTGEVYPSSGELTIGGFDVTTPAGFAQARKRIGYCP